MQNSAFNSQKKLNAWDIQRLILRCSKEKISSTDRLVLIALLDHYPTMRPGVRRIAEMAGMSERTIRSAIGRMKEKGAISVETVFLQPNIYHINVDFFSHLTVVPTPPPAGDAPPPLQEMHPPPAGDASKGIKIRREEEKNIGDSQSNITSSAAKREGGKEREQTDLERMVIETEEKEFAVIKKSFEREEKKEIIGDENKCDKIKEKAIAFGDAFMRIYPRSDGERGARIVIEQMWRNGIINRNNWEDILDAVKQQKNGHDLSRPWKFIPLAKNWLRDNRWLDEIRPARLAKKSKKKHMVGEYDPDLDGSTKIGW
jgi:DNA-binding Lrp family transcriptional regulator